MNPGKVFTKTDTLDQINEAYRDVAELKTIKSCIMQALQKKIVLSETRQGDFFD